jgi:hypothetical protein
MDAFDTVVRVVGLAVRDGIARSLLLTRPLEQRLACTPDVLRICSAFIPNADEITTCLGERSAELSDACRTAVEAGMKQLPDVSESTGARKRTAR